MNSDAAVERSRTAGSGVSRRSAWIGLALIGALFLALRMPVMYHQPGGYDEDFYAVPGLTILQGGVPRLPHVPARNPESVFIHADHVLYSEPPLYFYFQAALYSLLPDVYGTARLTSALAGLALVACVYRLSLAAGAGCMASLAGTALFSLSRWFYFPAICARPDTLCALFGLLAILAVLRWRSDQRRRWLLLMGACLGLGGLTHFFAIIYAIQLGLIVAGSSRGWGRLVNPAVLTLTSIVVFCAWLPLIAMAPDIFREQLGNQLGDTSGGPMWLRAIAPWESFRYQLPVMWEHIGAIQCVIPAAALLFGAGLGIATRNSTLLLVGGLGLTAVYLICVFVGPDHPVYGYWVYPAGLMFVPLASALDAAARRLAQLTHRNSSATTPDPVHAIAGVILASLLGLAFLPGCGLRTLSVHLRHWNDINYDSPRFARALMDTLPPDEVCAVDAQFVLDFVAAGRPALLATDYPPYFRVDQAHFDTLIVSRHQIDLQLTQRLNVQLVRTEGIESDIFACYAEIYEPPAPQ
ncbi:MAG: glycosyltransferase family 39 protein [Planctomycetaceae bacterium]|nr:glycosyltransferase family 39 protein [Planctomycetaceae bacterium]